MGSIYFVVTSVSGLCSKISTFLHEEEDGFVVYLYIMCTTFDASGGGLFTLGGARGDFSVRNCM